MKPEGALVHFGVFPMNLGMAETLLYLEKMSEATLNFKVAGKCLQ